MVETSIFQPSWWWVLPPLISFGIPGLIALIMLATSSGQVGDLPQIKTKSRSDYANAAYKGYQAYTKKKGVFKLKHPAHTFIMLPLASMDELNGRPEDEVSTSEEMADRFYGDWSTIGRPQPLLVRASQVKAVALTRRVSEVLAAECSNSITEDFKTNSGGDINVEETADRIVSNMIGAAIAGRELGRDERWIGLAARHAWDAEDAATALASWSKIRRYWSASTTSEVKKLQSNNLEMQQIIKPFVQERMKAGGNASEAVDILQLLINSATENEDFELETLAACMLDLALNVVAPISELLGKVLRELDMQPIEREAIAQEVRKAFNGTDARDQDLTKLEHLDSFIKETRRLNPPEPLATTYKILRNGGIRLNNGLTLPKGSYVAVSAYNVLRDSDRWSNHDEFDGSRFRETGPEEGEKDANHLIEGLEDEAQKVLGRGNLFTKCLATHDVVKRIVAILISGYDVRAAESHDQVPGGKGHETRSQARISLHARA